MILGEVISIPELQFPHFSRMKELNSKLLPTDSNTLGSS